MIKVNNIPVHTTIFPDNTSQVWKLPEELINKRNAHVDILWEFCNEGELMHLSQLVDLLNEYDISSSLELTYLPYGRQDKEISNTTTFALKTFANLINNMGFTKVTILDPHSTDALNLINNSYAIYPFKEVIDIFNLTSSDFICYPDNGAKRKYSSLYPFFHIYGSKKRNQLTGYIESYSIISSYNIKDKNILIVDDICDGGMTFKLLTKDLLKAGAREINLFVTHGIFSKGLRPLKDAGISRIFTSKGEISELQGNILYQPYVQGVKQ